MNRLIPTLMAAASLIMTALTAQSANIQITSLPFNITAPGTYVVTTTLPTYTNIYVAAITITDVTVPGPIILDLEGNTLTGGVNTQAINIQRAQSLPNLGSITVRNGTIQGFAYGVVVGVLSPSYTSHIHIDGLTLKNVNLNQTDNSTISNCTFVGGGDWGILDEASKGGNVYTNCYFDGTQKEPIIVSTLGTNNPVIPVVLEHCQFAAPTN